MSFRLLAYIPDGCLNPALEVSTQVRLQLNEAFAASLPAAPLPRNSERHTVNLVDPAQIERLKSMSVELQTAIGRVLGGLLYSLHLRRSSTASGLTVQPEIGGLRPGQRRVVSEASKLLREGKVVLSECGTGSGKSRIIAHLAAHAVDLHRAGVLAPVKVANAAKLYPEFMRPHLEMVAEIHAVRIQYPDAHQAVLVAAPSIENVAQLCREWRTVRKSLDPKGLIATCTVLGRGQFVSESAVLELLSDFEGDAKPIERWLAKGMPAGLTPSTVALRGVCDEVSALMDDLNHLAEPIGFDASDAALNEDSPAPEQEIYLRLRERAFESDIVFTTQAMLCLDAMNLSQANRGAMLPQPIAVFIDEAHMLESTQAQMASRTMSFARLLATLRTAPWKAARKGSDVAEVVPLLVRAQRALQALPASAELPVRDDAERSIRHAWQNAAGPLNEAARKLKQLLGASDGASIAKTHPELMRPVAYVRKCVRALQMLQDGSRGFLDLSPIRGNVSFTIGPPSVSFYLAARWATTPCAMLLSGTLLHYGPAGANPSATLRELAISDERGALTDPFEPSWLTSIPVMHMPSYDDFHRFVPPPAGDFNDLSLASWATEIAHQLEYIAGQAKGGTLVLMGGYDRLEAVAGALQLRGKGVAERLIVQTRTQGTSACVSAFRAAGAHGKRPIWLGTGPAWTGVDLSDRDVPDERAHEDNLLTDLVIPALPFGIEQGNTHRNRKRLMGFGVEVTEVLRKTRQGIGRLMRRDGVRDRHIWMLDGRLLHPAAVRYTADIRRWLVRYVNVEPISIGKV